VGSDGRKRGWGGEHEFGPDTIERVKRERVRATIEKSVEEELEVASGAVQSHRRDGVGARIQP